MKYIIKTKMDIQECMNVLEDILISDIHLKTAEFSYIGKVERDQSEFWVIDRHNKEVVNQGSKNRSISKFIGKLNGTMNGTTIEGEFVAQRKFVVVWLTYFLTLGVLVACTILLGVTTQDVEKEVLLIGKVLVLTIIGTVILRHRLKQSKASEELLVKFIERILKCDSKEQL